MKKVFAVSILTVMAVSAANATIVSQENIVGTGSVTVDVPTTGTNAGKVVVNSPSLATVATTGSYSDLSNKPSIPAAQVQSDWSATSGVTAIKNKPTLGTAAAKNATDTYSATGTDVVTGKAVASAISGKADTSAIPTKTSQLTNDSGFLTSHQSISGKMDKVVSADKNGVIVRKSDGTAMKGTGTDITVSDAGAITVAHATAADSATTATTATTAGTANAVAWGNVTGKPSTFTPSAHNQASNTINAMTDYAKADAAAAIAPTDSLNTAIGKLEKALDGKQVAGNYVPTTRKVNGKALSSDITLSAADVSAVPTTRKVNGKALSSDITLSAADVGADASGAAAAVETKLGAGANGYDINAKSLKVNGTAVLTSHNPIDSALSSTSTNAVQNKVINAALAAKQTTGNMVISTTAYGDDTSSTTKYPSMAVVDQMITDSADDLSDEISGLGEAVAGKQNKIAAGTAGNVVTYSGTAGTVGSLGFDTAPTANSTNLVKSGAIKTALDKKQDKSTANYQMGNSSGSWTTMTTQQQNMLNGKVPVGSETATTNTTYASIWVE